MKLPGLDLLMETCGRRGLSLLVLPPGRNPPSAGILIGNQPLDEVLAAVYARLGKAVFAADVAGMGLFRLDDEENELEASNASFREYTQPSLALPLVEFGGDTGLAYSYATVPALADARGRQPVVWVDCYGEPSVLPVASDVDAFFAAYARFLEALVTHADYRQPGDVPLAFPWGVPELLAPDARLVALLRAGSFAPLLAQTDETRQWVARVLASSPSRTT